MEDYIRKNLKTLKPYTWELTKRSIAEKYGLEIKDIIRFDQNTPAQNRISLDIDVNDYPDPSYDDLIKALSKYSNAKITQIVAGAGADEVIDVICKVFIDPGDKAVVSTPTYSMYQVCTEIMGGKVVAVPRDDDFSVDADKLLNTANKENAKIIFICNPNNPDGSLMPRKDIEKVLKGFKGPVVVDEAYFEFCNETVADLINSYQNLIVIRTLSKAFALAGMRIGYALACEQITNEMSKVRPPASISVFSEKLALKALSDISKMKKRVNGIIEEKERMKKELEKLGFEVFPSVTNFLLFKTGGVEDANRLFEKALRKGYVIRNFSKKKGCENCLRVTVRTKQDDNKLLSVFSNYSDGILFDVDGVLVDVSRSYREAIKQTVKEISGRKITAADIDEIKKLPNSNNDWNVSYALVKGITNMKSIDEKCEEYLEVKNKFQELYLNGLRDNEELLITKQTLSWLKQQGYKLGIVTSRPREEALYVLKPFIPEFFSEESIIALEDCDLEKPDPKPLILAKNRINARSAVYVGDTINDRLAAKSANMRYISVVPDSEAETVEDVNKIKEVL